MKQAAGPERDPALRLQLYGDGYVSFALVHPQHFAVMFDDFHGNSSEREAITGAMAYQTLHSAIQACQEAKLMQKGDSNELAQIAWALVHGLAKLAIGGRLQLGKEDGAVLKFTERATTVLFHGLLAPESKM
jgi:hypothetical protein